MSRTKTLVLVVSLSMCMTQVNWHDQHWLQVHVLQVHILHASQYREMLTTLNALSTGQCSQPTRVLSCNISLTHTNQYENAHNSATLAAFPDPAQLSVVCSLRAQGEPGNRTSAIRRSCNSLFSFESNNACSL